MNQPDESPDEHPPDGHSPEVRGPIAYMARNGVAANLLMFFILAAGFFSLGGLVQEVFPEISMDQVIISVPYPGATPDEVEESILRKIEEQIDAVDNIKEIRSTAAEGRGSVTVELQLGSNVARALDDIKARIDRIQTFPTGAERPEVTELTNRQSVIRLVLFGDVGERTLKELAYRTEDALSALPVVSHVETTGIREYEISVEVPLHQLRALGLTLGDIANAIRGGSLDLSAGSIDTRDEEVRIRTTGQNYTQHDFEEIIILSRADGTVVRLGDIAEVRDGFREVDLITRYESRPAAYVEVFRTSDEKVLDIVTAVEEHLEEEVIPALPAGVELEVWNNNGQLFESRLGLLVKNGLIGLALVLLSLTLFLDLRLAFWVAVGIAFSFVGTFAVMSGLGVSINMMTLFAFILAVGIVVDDAVVMGENIFAEREKGWRGVDASIRGTRRITGPVIFAVLTTVVAFCPLFFVPSVMGKLMTMLPIIVISVLLFSLVESLLVLPNHLSHLPRQATRRHPTRDHLIVRIQQGVDRALKSFVRGPLDRSLRVATAQPGLVIATGIALIILSVALVPAGIIRVNFMPTVEADLVTATLEMPEGTPAGRTSEMADFVEASGHRAIARLSPEGAGSLLEGVNVTVGQEARQMQPIGSAGSRPESQPRGSGIQARDRGTPRCLRDRLPAGVAGGAGSSARSQGAHHHGRAARLRLPGSRRAVPPGSRAPGNGHRQPDREAAGVRGGVRRPGGPGSGTQGDPTRSAPGSPNHGTNPRCPGPTGAFRVLRQRGGARTAGPRGGARLRPPARRGTQHHRGRGRVSGAHAHGW